MDFDMMRILVAVVAIVALFASIELSARRGLRRRALWPVRWNWPVTI